MDKENKNPNVPNLRFNYAGNWTINTLDEICDFYKGNGLSKSDLSSEGRPCILYGELYTSYKKEIIDSIISKTDTMLSKPFISKKNDVIIPGSGEDPIDIAVARAIENDGIILGGDLNVLRLHPKYSGAFLSYQLNGKRRYEIAKKAQGKSIVHLHNSDLKDIKVFMPQYDEQLKIINLLKHIDKRIELQNKIIKKYESLIKSIEEKLWKSNDSSYVPIKDFLIEKNEKSTIQDQYPVLSSTVKGLFLQSDYFQREVASSNNIGYKITKLNDIIISPQNLWMGNITYNDKFENGIVSPSYHIYEIRDGYNKQYIATILKSYKALYRYKSISEQGASVVRRNLNMDAFLDITFPIPSKRKQDEAGMIIQQFHLKLDVENQYLDSLFSQKTYFLNNMFI